MENLKKRRIRELVMADYKKVALSNSSCGCNSSACCGPTQKNALDNLSAAIGYSDDDLKNVPEGSNMGLGCGNPQAIASLKTGETVLDLGSGAGFDCFLASRSVGETGKVIGVDMTPEMISKARTNAENGGYSNVDFRLGEIEHLPVSDSTVDVIISNCVINLSPDKEQVFLEAFRVLKPGGRLAISDIVSIVELPNAVKSDLSLYSGCMVGASSIDELNRMLEKVGFIEIRIDPKDKSREFIKEWTPGRGIENYVLSANIEAVKFK
ncbi:arsenite methyltransferase [Labilibacter sediminis]|nr:arsenite methyltransferase [Labilibacter sediminis]